VILTQILSLISRADWSDKSEWYCPTAYCFQNIWFNKRTHPKEHQNGHQQLSTKWAGPGRWLVTVRVCRKRLCI